MLTCGQLIFHRTFEGRLEQTDLPRSRITCEFFQCAIAYPAFGGGHGTNESGVVVGVGDEAQVGNQILNLGAIKK